MSKTIRQHYVPRTYLKHFSFDGKRLHTFLLNKDTPSVIGPENWGDYVKDISISDVCVGQNFYTIDEANQHNNRGLKSMALEIDFFQNYVEPKLSSIIQTIESLVDSVLKDNTLIASIRFSNEQLYDLAFSSFVQYHRSPRQRHSIESVNSLIRYVLKSERKEKGLDDSEDIKGLDVAFTHADKTYLNTYLWRMFYAKISSYCILIRVSTNGNLFTSDNPVVIHKLGAKGKAVFDVNFYQDEFSLFFPLTPNIILEYYNPSFFPDAIMMDKTISIVDSAYENQVNKYQYINAERFIFSPKNDFSLFLKPKH